MQCHSSALCDLPKEPTLTLSLAMKLETEQRRLPYSELEPDRLAAQRRQRLLPACLARQHVIANRRGLGVAKVLQRLTLLVQQPHPHGAARGADVKREPRPWNKKRPGQQRPF